MHICLYTKIVYLFFRMYDKIHLCTFVFNETSNSIVKSVLIQKACAVSHDTIQNQDTCKGACVFMCAYRAEK